MVSPRRVAYIATPFGLSLGALVCLVLIFLAGIFSHNRTFDDFYFVKIDLTNLTPTSASTNTLSGDTSNNLTVFGSAPEANNKFFGLQDYYTVYLRSYCGWNGHNTYANCTAPQSYFWFNLVEVWGLNSTGVPAQKYLPRSLRDGLDSYHAASKAIFVLYVAALAATTATLVVGVCATFSRWGSFFTTVCAGAASILFFGASGVASGIFFILRTTLNHNLKDDYGIETSIGAKSIALSWVGTTFAVGAGFFWLLSVCCCRARRPRNPGNREEGRTMVEKSSVRPCETCRDFYFFFLTEKVENIKASAEKGCTYCDQIFRAIEIYATEMHGHNEEFTAYRMPSSIDIVYPSAASARPRPGKVQIPIYGRGDENAESYGGLSEFVPLSPTNIPQLSGDTSSDQALQSVRGWLQDCETNHKQCCVLTKKGRLPTRVLKMGLTPEDIRLYESKSESEPYICLSHCWGLKPEFLRLLKENLQDLKRKIEWDDLPQTFKDAAIFTHKLGVRYLWIDSLCIIQEDDDDWNREAVAMHKIYRHAYLTLAATKSSTPHEGMFVSTHGKYDIRELPHSGGRPQIT